MIASEWIWFLVQAVAVAAAAWLVFVLVWEFLTRRVARRSAGRNDPEAHEDEERPVRRAA